MSHLSPVPHSPSPDPTQPYPTQNPPKSQPKNPKHHNTYMRDLKNRYKQIYAKLCFDSAVRVRLANRSAKRFRPMKGLDSQKGKGKEKGTRGIEIDKDIKQSQTQINLKVSDDVVLEENITPNMFNVEPTKKKTSQRRPKSSYKPVKRVKHFANDGNLKDSAKVYSQIHENFQNERRLYSKSRADKIVKDYNLRSNQNITELRSKPSNRSQITGSAKPKRPFTAKTRVGRNKRRSQIIEDIKSYKPVLKGGRSSSKKYFRSDHVVSTYIPNPKKQKKIAKRLLKARQYKHYSSDVLTDHLGCVKSKVTKKTSSQKSLSPQKSYQRRRKNIMKRLSEDSQCNFWPTQMKVPEMYKSFYWSPDYSYCGFATDGNIRKTAQKWHKAPNLSFNKRLKDSKNMKAIKNISCIPVIAEELK
ncbi:unnamed protein product [Moneuplotes crassus]|uniref:Uncharacterized protein n=1 Tax=Euplotes crassus TaxID=5936 RepID=A0AAD1XDS1_EUPCR|nr:unnamed protein product [Moneuplotes crassus]